MTKSATRKQAERIFLAANPDAVGASIVWTHGPARVEWADGSRGWSGTFTATAAGFRTRPMCVASHDGEGMTVR
jgi:hypothetical protein